MLNHVTLQGRFVRDPEMRRTNSGKAVVSFTLACDKGGKNTGASFLDCVAWEKTGEFIANYFQKGNAIIVEGRLESRQYETKEGQKRTVAEVVVTQAHFCEKKAEAEDRPYMGGGRKANDSEMAQMNTFEPMTGEDLELPF